MNLPNGISLADKFRLLRKRENLSQYGLSELTGVPQSTISNVEKGRNKSVSADVLAKFAAIPSLFPYSMWLLVEVMTDDQIQETYDFLQQLKAREQK